MKKSWSGKDILCNLRRSDVRVALASILLVTLFIGFGNIFSKSSPQELKTLVSPALPDPKPVENLALLPALPLPSLPLRMVNPPPSVAPVETVLKTESVPVEEEISKTELALLGPLPIVEGVKQVSQVSPTVAIAEPLPTLPILPMPSVEGPAPQLTTYLVQQGDVPGALAKKFSVSVAELLKANKLSSPAKLRAGKTIIIPNSQLGNTETTIESPQLTKSETIPNWNNNYVIQKGDVPGTIAKQFGVTVKELLELNQISDPKRLTLGMSLKIPQTNQSVNPTSHVELPPPETAPVNTSTPELVEAPPLIAPATENQESKTALAQETVSTPPAPGETASTVASLNTRSVVALDLPVNLLPAPKSAAEGHELSRVYFKRGLALVKTNELTDAARNFNRAIYYDANYAEAYYNLGTLNVKRELYDGAVKRLESALAIRQNYPEAAYNLGLAYLGKGDKPGAVASFRKFIALAKTSPRYQAQVSEVRKVILDLEFQR